MSAPVPSASGAITPLAALTVVLAAGAAMLWPSPSAPSLPTAVLQEHDAYPHPIALAMRLGAVHERAPGRSAALAVRVRLLESPRRRSPP